MKLLEKLKAINPKDALGIAMAIGTGVVAVVNALSEQKKEKEYEEMKKIVFGSKSEE